MRASVWMRDSGIALTVEGDRLRHTVEISSLDSFFLPEHTRWMVSDQLRLYAASTVAECLIDDEPASATE